MSKRPCFVYLIGHEHAVFGHAVKVGISENLNSRLSQLQTGCCEQLTIYFSFELPDRQMAAQVESIFHESFDASAIRGEWFGMAPERALYLVTQIIVEILRMSGVGPDALAQKRSDIGVPRAFNILDRQPYEMVSRWMREAEEALG